MPKLVLFPLLEIHRPLLRQSILRQSTLSNTNNANQVSSLCYRPTYELLALVFVVYAIRFYMQSVDSVASAFGSGVVTVDIGSAVPVQSTCRYNLIELTAAIRMNPPPMTQAIR